MGLTEDDRPVLLDPTIRTSAEESELLYAAGPVVRVELPGGVPAWAVTHDAPAREVMRDSRFVKDINRWGAWKRGEIPADWPLIGLVDLGPSLVSTDGTEHRRLRRPVAREFTPQRVEALRGRVEEITRELLDRTERAADDAGGVVDLKDTFAFPLPITVVGELFGMPTEWHRPLRELYDSFFDDKAAPETVLATLQGLYGYIARLVRLKRDEPGADLTSALLSELGDEPSEEAVEELIATIQVMITAGHETSVHLIVNAVRSLLGDPAQLELVHTGRYSWDDVVEESLRLDSPTLNFLFRFATEDIDIAGTLVREGEGVVISYGGMGRDRGQHGADADRFDISRRPRHTSFGHGPHSCPGSALARLETTIALRELFARFPGLRLADPDGPPERSPSVIINGQRTLPVRLG
ncbi:cytochrome P450 107B1 (P450CVIIB1) [Streptomyces himastatinicus ATCC 53653]|uniref:Cytochrome P450 107B1 (P450CVIIB1) n=1 Tax=Streptomyces himastatinicus ATCC 53653 TaxID=457427 RepID=D9WPU3_9ACTN|nr:cytochrome P450 [Streptomyces himastatinicus]EFL23947.1 cytochrome P450 107B1 (P450CVIIB1) [Streptomyces himastatinicus ATCC 53653]